MSKLRVDQLENLADTKTINVEDIVDNVGNAILDTSQGNQSVRQIIDGALSSGSPHHKELRFAIERRSGSGYPQGIFVDEVEDKLYVGHSRGSDTETSYSVYSWVTGALEGWFTAGAADFPEGFAVVHEGGSKYLYTRADSGTEGDVGKYALDGVSLTGGSASLDTSYDVGMHYQMSYDGEFFYVEKRQEVGTFNDRRAIVKYDSSFVRQGGFSLPAAYAGSNESEYVPKKQSFAVRGEKVALGIGGDGTGSDPEVRKLQGCVTVTTSGKVLQESLHTFDAYVENLNQFSGVSGATYSENEGTYITEDHQVYTLSATASSDPILIIREFCFPGPDTVDFSSSAASLQSYSGAVAYPAIESGSAHSVMSGSKLSTLADVFAEMRETGLRRFEFYSTAVDIELEAGTPFDSFARVTVYNLNNTTGFAHVETQYIYKRYLLQYDSGAGTLATTMLDVVPTTISDANSVDDLPNGQYRTNSGTANIPGSFGILNIYRYDGFNIYQEFLPSENAAGTNREFYRKYSSSIGSWSTWHERWGTHNTTVDGSGFIKEASPIAKVFTDSVETNEDAVGISLVKESTGVYRLKGSHGLAKQGWYVETPKDANNNIKVFVEVSEEGDDVLLKTYVPDYSTGPATAGEPVDIPAGRWVDIRFNYPEA